MIGFGEEASSRRRGSESLFALVFEVVYTTRAAWAGAAADLNWASVMPPNICRRERLPGVEHPLYLLLLFFGVGDI